MEKVEPETCEHEWQRFTETLSVQERTKKQIEKGMAFRGTRAYFIVKACPKCKSKVRLDMKVEI